MVQSLTRVKRQFNKRIVLHCDRKSLFAILIKFINQTLNGASGIMMPKKLNILMGKSLALQQRLSYIINRNELSSICKESHQRQCLNQTVLLAPQKPGSPLQAGLWSLQAAKTSATRWQVIVLEPCSTWSSSQVN